MGKSYQRRQLAHVRHVFRYWDNTRTPLPLLNPIPIPDPILRICRVCLNTENLHLELAVGKQNLKTLFGTFKCNHRCETAARLSWG